MSTNIENTDEQSVDDDDGTWTTIPKKKKRGVGVITEDHPVVKKILEFIKKVIKPIENEEVKNDEFNEYMGRLPEKELVIYAIYKRLSFIPAIYKYDERFGLSEDDEIKLRGRLDYRYLNLDS